MNIVLAAKEMAWINAQLTEYYLFVTGIARNLTSLFKKCPFKLSDSAKDYKSQQF